MHTFDRAKPIPLYYQLKELVKGQIERQELKPRDCLPSEREYSDRYGISRMTVRQAITELVNEGLLVRQQGKGTYVADTKIERGLMKLTSFTEDMQSRGYQPSAHLISVQEQLAEEPVAAALGLSRMEKVLVIKRLRLADGEPMALETCHLPQARFADILEEDFQSESLYQILRERYQVIPERANQTIEPSIARPQLAKLLQIRTGDPVLSFETVTFDQAGRPIEYVTATYRGDRYKFFVELKKFNQ